MFKLLFSFLLAFQISLMAFEKSDTLKLISDNFEHFNYDSVINIGEKFLSSNPKLEPDLKIDILLKMTISAYSMGNKQASELYILRILKEDPNYQLSDSRVSPKIVEFYDEIKSNIEFNTSVTTVDTVIVYKELPPSIKYISKEIPPLVLLKSIILPGLSHFEEKKDLKSIAILSLSILSAISSIYYAIETGRLESEYLAQVNQTQIDAAYEKYSSAYKLRNASLSIFGAVWVYSQLDIILFSREIFEKSKGDQTVITGFEMRLRF